MGVHLPPKYGEVSVATTIYLTCPEPTAFWVIGFTIHQRPEGVDRGLSQVSALASEVGGW